MILPPPPLLFPRSTFVIAFSAIFFSVFHTTGSESRVFFVPPNKQQRRKKKEVQAREHTRFESTLSGLAYRLNDLDDSKSSRALVYTRGIQGGLKRRLFVVLIGLFSGECTRTAAAAAGTVAAVGRGHQSPSKHLPLHYYRMHASAGCMQGVVVLDKRYFECWKEPAEAPAGAFLYRVYPPHAALTHCTLDRFFFQFSLESDHSIFFSRTISRYTGDKTFFVRWLLDYSSRSFILKWSKWQIDFKSSLFLGTLACNEFRIMRTYARRAVW